MQEIFRNSGKKHRPPPRLNYSGRMEEVEQIDWEEETIGSLVKVNKDLQDQKKLQERVREISKQLKETGKEKINSTDIDSVNGKSRQGSNAIMNCQISLVLMKMGNGRKARFDSK